MKLRASRGAALMLALWALFLLSAMIMSWAMDVGARLNVNGAASQALEAEAMACSGSEVAMHPGVKPGAAALHGNFSRTQHYEARLTGEGGRLNLNWVVAGENADRLEILRKYLEIKGVDLNERDHMIDCLLDWVDPDNLVRLNGAEEDGDYKPANTLLTRVDDLKRVRGWEEFTRRPNWDADFTVNSTGPVDLVWASRELILSLPGMNDGVVDRFLALRRGPDELDGTEDDPEFKSMDEVRVAFGFPTEQFKQLAPLIGFKDPVMRVISVGQSGNVTRTVQMVVRKTGAIPQLITWKEM